MLRGIAASAACNSHQTNTISLGHRKLWVSQMAVAVKTLQPHHYAGAGRRWLSCAGGVDTQGNSALIRKEGVDVHATHARWLHSMTATQVSRAMIPADHSCAEAHVTGFWHAHRQCFSLVMTCMATQSGG